MVRLSRGGLLKSFQSAIEESILEEIARINHGTTPHLSDSTPYCLTNGVQFILRYRAFCDIILHQSTDRKIAMPGFYEKPREMPIE